MGTAPQEEWEHWVEGRAANLFTLGYPEKVLELLVLRTERLPDSRLHRLESVAQRSLPTPDLDSAGTAATRAVQAARVARDPAQLRDALEERITVCRLREDTPGLMRALAELGNLGDLLGDDLVVLTAAVEGLESLEPGEQEPAGELSHTAVRVFSRLPDELVARAPELARRVAAQVGDQDVELLRRVVRLVGLGATDEGSQLALRDILQAWTARDPDVANVLRATSDQDLPSAAQYLLTSRAVAPATLEAFTSWLREYASPSRPVLTI